MTWTMTKTRRIPSHHWPQALGNPDWRAAAQHFDVLPTNPLELATRGTYVAVVIADGAYLYGRTADGQAVRLKQNAAE